MDLLYAKSFQCPTWANLDVISKVSRTVAYINKQTHILGILFSLRAPHFNSDIELMFWIFKYLMTVMEIKV